MHARRTAPTVIGGSPSGSSPYSHRPAQAIAAAPPSWCPRAGPRRASAPGVRGEGPRGGGSAGAGPRARPSRWSHSERAVHLAGAAATGGEQQMEEKSPYH